MKALSKETQILRSHFLYLTRSYLFGKDFYEIDTPILKPVVGMEPYLDPFLVESPKGDERGYLITSPEYSLKQTLATGLDRIYEITHTFRSGEQGSPIHSREFLMLELYVKGWDDKQLIDFIKDYFIYLFLEFSNSVKKNVGRENAKLKETIINSKSVEQMFNETTGMGFDKESLLIVIQKHSLTNTPLEELKDWQYEDLFFLVFLNLVEPKLGEGIVFLYDYPPECAALSKIKDGCAKRFEIYWDGVELANAFWELTDAKEQEARFKEEQNLRKKLGKEVFPMDRDFLSVLESGNFPESAGISLGLDRIFMKLINQTSLADSSPYYV
jgi:lysyl-tRNA synthetase class 2